MKEEKDEKEEWDLRVKEMKAIEKKNLKWIILKIVSRKQNSGKPRRKPFSKGNEQ